MPLIQIADTEIAYLDEGDGPPVVLIHGFASNAQVNWVQSGWVKTLVDAGYRVIAPDNRGHGGSRKFYDPKDYSIAQMAIDIIALLDHLAIPRVDVIGYSMGGRIAAELAVTFPTRVRSAILAGIGLGLIRGGGPGENVAQALEAPSRDQVADEQGRLFRNFARQTGSDLHALAACMRGSRQLFTSEDMARIAAPVLIAVGTADDIAGSAQDLAALIEGAEVLDIPRRDHMRAVGDSVFKSGVLQFLSSRA